MNTKRQTIWLVSMLGLMVVLSAYYLFTDTPGKNGTPTNIADSVDSGVEIEETSDHVHGIDLDELLSAVDKTSSTDASSITSDASNDTVLKKVQAGALTAEEQLDGLVSARNDKLSIEAERLFDIVTDTKKSPEEVTSAQERIRELEEQQAVMSDIEDELMREYENVVITEDGGKWRVVVQADKLKKSEVVTIVDMMVDRLKVKPHKVAVEFIN